MLEVDDVTRTFRGNRGRTVHALRGVRMSAAAGEVVGLLGLNGAGKTTLTKIVATLLLPTTGTVRVDGIDVVAQPRRARAALSVVLGGERGLYQRLDARENIRFFATLSGVPRRELGARCEAALEVVHLGPVANRAVQTYSRGMRQRLHLAIGLVARPRLLLLDEPTVGLDPIEAQSIRDTVAGLRRDGTCIVLTSHYLADIEQLADRVVILDEGRTLLDLPLPELIARARAVARVTISGTDRDRRWTTELHLPEWTPAALHGLADQWPAGRITDVQVSHARLEDVFRELTAARAERATP
ncbi:ABC transporter ATP-binding protein [Amycolatopsis sp. PS_44_ISF1]|uniref:ABC transporter ATP-binding protein n=1 Tax=Amycolatopsis sp. PS_44_ISF1 TaxID=2974917 RepID=UPI0028E04D20|nr:ABC transporter ATP-binding protein [Amycolatopsis sp. PS_44_ISF1]MDT8913508.1 ABC transporter ATP-binding protein [Amycolatopsis sp. PS_44_ISF1]